MNTVRNNEYKLKKQKKAIIILLFMCIFLLLLIISTIIKLTNKIEENWECEQILYIYSNDGHPSVMINSDYYNHPLVQPDVKSWFCKPNTSQCVADVIENAYDDYCIKWVKVKRIDNVINIPFMLEYIEEQIAKNNTIPVI